MFNEQSKKKINDLEREIRTLRDLQQRQSQPRIAIPSGALAIGRRLPWVCYKLTWTYIDSGTGYGLYWLPEVTGVTGQTYWGSEKDVSIHASEENGGNGAYAWPKFDFVGHGTWLAIVNVQYKPLGVNTTSSGVVDCHTFFTHLAFYDQVPEFAYLMGQDFYTITQLSRSGADAINIEHQALISVDRRSAYNLPTPDSPFELWISFHVGYTFYRLPTPATLVTASNDIAPFSARITFIKLDSETMRRNRLLLPGDGVEIVDPPPDPDP